MFKLVIKKNNALVSEVILTSGSSYIVGRGSSSSIQLPAEVGVSREHLSLLINDKDECEVKLISKSGEVLLDGSPVVETIITDRQKLKLSNYILFFTKQDYKNTLKDVKPDVQQNVLADGDSDEILPFHDEPEGLDALDQTRTNFTQIDIYLSVWGDSVKKQFKLTGDTWTVGRDEHCDITINHPQLSRRHFEIKKENGGFIIFDLDSSNGTLVNGMKATTSNPLTLSVGDKITVESLNFEISEYDSLFEEHLNNVQMPALIPEASSPMAGMPLPAEHIGASVLKVNHDGSTTKVKSSKFNKKIAVRALVAFVIVGAVAFETLKPDATKDDRAPSSVNAITDEQKAFFRDTLQLAKHHFMERRYSLCTSEIKKIHDKVDSFENSKDISSLCLEAAEREKILADERRKKEQRTQVEDQVESVLSKCRQLAKSTKNVAKLSACLEPVLDLDPTNEEANELVTTLQEKIEADRISQTNRRNRAALISKSKKRFNSAKKLYDAGELRSARSAYKKYLKSGLPDPGGLKKEASRDIASINSKIQSVVDAKVEDCQNLVNSGDYKSAIISCNIALREDSSSSKAKELKKDATLQLRKAMQEIYQKSILEENYGNLKVAQKAWLSILEKDVKDGEYHLKASTKLKKYGQ